MNGSYNPKLIEKYQQNYLNKLRQYAKLSMSKMNFATVYIVNELSTKLEGVDTYYKKISNSESSVRYTKIINYPLFSLTERSSDVQFDFEAGFKSLDTTTTCKVLPLKIRVGIGDLVVLNGIDKELLYEAKETNVKQDNMSIDLQFSELTLKVKGNGINDVEAQVSNIIEYCFEQDLFISSEKIAKYRTLMNLVNLKWGIDKNTYFERYNGFINDDLLISYNEEFKNCFANGLEFVSYQSCLQTTQNELDFSNITIDVENDDIVTLSNYVDNIRDFEDLLKLIKLISLKIKLKMNTNLRMEIL
jgi:hypothetical protein